MQGGYNMKNDRGVTLVSLSIYVIVAAVVIGSLTFLNVNFFSKIDVLTNETLISNEHSKFLASFIKDVKNSDKVSEYSETRIKFSDNATYEIRRNI